MPASVPAPVVAQDADESAHAVLRLLEAPDEVEIEAPHGVPAAIWWHGRRVCITDADGPERLSGDWWRADVFARDYWRCTAADEGELLLYAESARWFVQGWYD